MCDVKSPADTYIEVPGVIDHNTAPKGRRPFAITGNGSLRCFAHFGVTSPVAA